MCGLLRGECEWASKRGQRNGWRSRFLGVPKIVTGTREELEFVYEGEMEEREGRVVYIPM